MKVMSWNELAAAVHKNAVDHGWWDEEREAAEIFALIHSELSEALEEYRSGNPLHYIKGSPNAVRRPKPEGIAVELADCVIRILDYCGKEQIDIGGELEERRAGFDSYALPALVNECHCLVSQAYDNTKETAAFLAECVALIEYWCEENGSDLKDVIRKKHEYNKTRPYRHGGKKC